LTMGGPGSRRILAKLRAVRGAFQGKLRCAVDGLPCLEFYTAVYDLGDTGLAIVNLDGTHASPAGILAAIPRSRRDLLRNDFAFELMTVLSFLGSPVNHGCELAIHDYMEETLRTEPLATQVFAVETAETSSDVAIVLSAHFEHLAAAMLNWMAERESPEDALFEIEESRIGTAMPSGCQLALPDCRAAV